ncbi:uncharacterized protein LOC143449860 [Clavelina lepadiformis]|uniref:uncharacterized protein LOC143449860 n=1 Tax=Clavelina lepadiformis TaxID=159417 RepID=UPI004042D070
MRKGQSLQNSETETKHERKGIFAFRKTCLQQNTNLYVEYKHCVNSLHENRLTNTRAIDFDPIIDFVENHWMCYSSIPGSCSPKGSNCHSPDWLRRTSTFVSRRTLIRRQMKRSNNEIFPRFSFV